MRVLTAAQMREADRQTIEEIGIPSIVLMENAGRQVADTIESRFAGVAGDGAAGARTLFRRRISVLCGRGSNGGDGFVVARRLHQRGAAVGAFLLGRLDEVRGDALTNLNVLRRLGLAVVEIPDEAGWNARATSVLGCDVLVDAVFGTGLQRPVEGLVEKAILDLNEADVPVIAVDLPSGLSADTPEVHGAAVRATLTVTLAAPKLPLVLPPAHECTGELVVAEIGIPQTVIEGLAGPRVEIITPGRVRGLLRPRAPGAHKGDFGRVLIVAGSPGKTGAARLAALGALRAGAGLVTVATPRACQSTVAAGTPEVMTEGLADAGDGTIAAAAVDRVLGLHADVIAAGPGLGVGPSTASFVRGLLARADRPLVLDADALNVLAGEPHALRADSKRPVIITPHPGEMARLAGTTVSQVQANRLETARRFATAHQVYVVLKGARTIVATPDGAAFINLTGNPGMASGGTGDVLTGIVAATVAQLRDVPAACRLAVHLHGLAGDLAAAEVGEVSLIATDLTSHLGRAVLRLTAS